MPESQDVYSHEHPLPQVSCQFEHAPEQFPVEVLEIALSPKISADSLDCSPEALGKPEEFSESESDSEESDNDPDSVWTAPIVRPGDLEYQIWKLLPLEEHKAYDQLAIDLLVAFKGSWPSPEDVYNDVNLVASVLVLVLATAAPHIPLKPEWRHAENLLILAEQDILREAVSNAVRWKSFVKLRSLGLWYEGH